MRLAAAVTVAALGVNSCDNDEVEPTVGKEDVAVRLYITNSDGVESETADRPTTGWTSRFPIPELFYSEHDVSCSLCVCV